MIYGPVAPKISQIQLNQHMSTGDIKADQENDTDLTMIRQWLVMKRTPLDNELALASPAAKHYWINKESYCVNLGVVWKTTDEGNLLLLVPSPMRETVLRYCMIFLRLDIKG